MQVHKDMLVEICVIMYADKIFGVWHFIINVWLATGLVDIATESTPDFTELIIIAYFLELQKLWKASQTLDYQTHKSMNIFFYSTSS